MFGLVLRDESKSAVDLGRRGNSHIENELSPARLFFQSPGEWMETISVLHSARSTNRPGQNKTFLPAAFFDEASAFHANGMPDM
jgi:hypothetical protein